MSRAYKQKLIDTYGDLGGAGATANFEQASGADLAQLLLAAENGSLSANLSATGVKTLGSNVRASALTTVVSDTANNIVVVSTDSLFIGQIIDIVSPTGSSVRADDRTISAIDYNTKTVTYSGADASGVIVANDVVVLSTQVNNAALSGADLNLHAGNQ